jgi:hypothetical protein
MHIITYNIQREYKAHSPPSADYIKNGASHYMRGRFLKYRNAAVKNELLRRTEDKLWRRHWAAVLPKNNLI